MNPALARRRKSRCGGHRRRQETLGPRAHSRRPQSESPCNRRQKILQGAGKAEAGSRLAAAWSVRAPGIEERTSWEGLGTAVALIQLRSAVSI